MKSVDTLLHSSRDCTMVTVASSDGDPSTPCLAAFVDRSRKVSIIPLSYFCLSMMDLRLAMDAELMAFQAAQKSGFWSPRINDGRGSSADFTFIPLIEIFVTYGRGVLKTFFFSPYR